MKTMRKTGLHLLLIFSMLLSVFSGIAVEAVYVNDYDGGAEGDGNGIYTYGVDLSEWQGSEVDFNKIREQGYSFVILRAGFASTIDDCFEGNYSRAKAAGLHIGAYLYSYADNTEEALEEAKAMKSWLSGKTLDYPVYYDLEDPKCHGDMSREELTEIALTFMDEMAAAGWLVGLYSCKSWLETKIDTARIGETYECWMAQFVSSGTYDIYDRYDEVYGMWQYSCTGTVEGVPGGVDMNVCFKDYPGICRQYGFNGHVPSDETLSLSGSTAPAVLKLGEELPITGRVTSSKGNLISVTAGIYSMSGNMLTGRSIGPKKASYDLSELSAGVHAKQLPEGAYIFRITAGNSYETRILLNAPLYISKDGICARNVTVPENIHQSAPFLLSGEVLSAELMKTLVVKVYGKNGVTELELRTSCNEKSYDLSLFQVDLAAFAVGEYRLVVEALTDRGSFYPVDLNFSLWAANDPVTLEKVVLQSEYFPGELTEIQGTLRSANSGLRQIDIEILDAQGAGISKVSAQPRQKQTELSQYSKRLGLDRLGIGAYRICITAVNDGGPQLILDRKFLIREDGLSLCGFDVQRSLYLGDSMFLCGAVVSDVTSLTYVGFSVIDGEGRTLLSAGAIPKGNLFDLSGLRDQLTFSELSLGEYSLRLTAENESIGRILYEGTLTVVDHSDVIRWQDPCLDPRGISFSPLFGFVLSGSLRSAVSPIEEIIIELSDEAGENRTRAVLYPGTHTAELERANELLRFSALPKGEYTLRIQAKNAAGSFELLRSPFTVGDCYHGNIRSGDVIQPDCLSAGAVTDSRCTECGGKVRSGFLIDAMGHAEENGSCKRCAQKGYIQIDAEQHYGLPLPYERYILAVFSEGKWYALDGHGKTVRIDAPDENGIIHTNAGLLWAVERRGDVYYLRAPDGRLLHLDSEDVTVAGGRQNAELTLQIDDYGLSICLLMNEDRALSFAGEEFIPSDEGIPLSIFRYKP